MSNDTFTSIYGIYTMTLELAGKRAGEFRKSLVCFSVAFILQGLAFGMFYPLLSSLFAGNRVPSDVVTYLGGMVLFSILSLAAKWKGHDFDYTGNVVDVTHSLRTQLGVRLRMMPLEKLAAHKTGELNAVFSGNVDESVLNMGMVSAVVLQLAVVPLTMVAVTFFVDWRLAVVMLVT